MMAIILFSFFLNFETGPVWTGYNDVRIPGDSGTMISLEDELRSYSQVYYRLRGGLTISEKHSFSMLYAPLRLKSGGILTKDVRFADTDFNQGDKIDAYFKFNSYRLTYAYTLLRNERFFFSLGVTGKIRDAYIEFNSAGKYAKKENTGFVPLINFQCALSLDRNFSFFLGGDALAAPQGRAEDILLSFRYQASDNALFEIGYRILEGGADNREVYTFSMFHYLALGVVFSWN